MVKIQKLKIYSPLSIRKRAQDYSKQEEPREVSQGRRGPTVGNLTSAVKDCFGLSDSALETQGKSYTDKDKMLVEDSTRLVLSWLFLDTDLVFSPTSRGALTPQQINALGHWMYGPSFNEPYYRDWEERRTFKDELTWVLFWVNEARKWTDQSMELALDEEDIIRFGDILTRYQKETVINDGEPGYWDLSVLSSVEKQVIEDPTEKPKVEPSQEAASNFIFGGLP